MLQRSTERHGVGQSGYTAGRQEDLALDLQIQTQPEVVREDPTTDQHDDTEIQSDDRWSGRGGELATQADHACVLQPPSESEPE